LKLSFFDGCEKEKKKKKKKKKRKANVCQKTNLAGEYFYCPQQLGSLLFEEEVLQARFGFRSIRVI
jgi:hypothetical protein